MVDDRIIKETISAVDPLPLRILYLPNEPTEGYQVGYRAAMERLEKSGAITACKIFSFYVEEQKLGSWVATLDRLLEIAQEFKPHAIVVAHIGSHVFPEDFVRKLLKSSSVTPILAYDERDVYGYFRKPMPKGILAFSAWCDVVFVVASGNYANRFRRAGCRNVRLLPHAADTRRFGKAWEPTLERKYDVVMLANRSRSRIPFRSMPGIREREELARKLYQKYGSRFGLFGRGWDGFGGHQGAVPFESQEEVLRSSWISVGQDHFPTYENYFSDRLPIALLSKVTHICSAQPGLEDFFTHREHCIFYRSVDEAVDACDALLKGPREELNAMGVRGYLWALKYFTEDHRMEKMVSEIKALYGHRLHRSST